MIPTALDKHLGLVTSVSAAALTDASGTPLKLAYARRWQLWIQANTQAISLVRYRVRGQSDWPWSAWVTATGVAPAAGAVGTVSLDGDCSLELDVEVTAAGAGTADFYLVGV